MGQIGCQFWMQIDRDKNVGGLPLAFLYNSNMIEKSTPSEQRIIDCLKINYGIEVATLTFIPLGAIDDFTLTVFLFVDGRDGFSRDLTDDQWYTLGKVMRQIHEINVPLLIQAKIRRESYSSKWRQAMQSLYPLIESEPSGDMVAVNLLTFMKKHTAAIYRLVDRAEQLAQRVQGQSSQFVLCHSDLHGGNVLIDENDIIYIVDWDDPIIAPKERDLMFIGGGVANVWNKPHEKELFYKGYGKAEVNMTLLAYYRHERVVEDIALYGQQLLLTMAGGQDRIKWYEQFIAQFDPQGVVEIAFKTDESLTI